MSKLRGYLSSLRENFKLTRKVHPWVGLEMLAIFLGAAAIVAVPVSFFLNWLTGLLVGLPVGLLAMTYWFSRRAMNAAYSQIEGQAGAAVAVIQQMRGNWSITPAVAVTKNSDIVSRVVGRPGVILVGEGPAQRVTHLLANERKKTARWLPEVPIYEIQVGTDADQLSVAKVQRELNRLPRALRPAEVNDVRRRLDAFSKKDSPVPIPKGPLPKGGKIPKSMRG
jgi:hypothetical protein